MSGDKNPYLDELAQQVKARLPEYLRLQGREVTKSNGFKCIYPANHTHNDRTPTASMDQKGDGTWVWNCPACGVGGTIFHIAEELEGLPRTGPGWISTVMELAERLGIPIEADKLPEESRKSHVVARDTLELMREIESYLTLQGDPVECLTSGRFGRTYSAEQAIQATQILPLGCVDTVAITEHLRSKFTNLESLMFYNGSTGLLDPNVFAKDRMTISVRNHLGKPIGFTGRIEQAVFQAAKEAGEKIPKYKFTVGASRRGLLFMMDVAKAHMKRDRKAYLVEGPFDCLSMHLAGYPGTVAIQGSSLTDEQAAALAGQQILSLIWVPDGDLPGMRSIRKGLLVTSTYPEIVVSAVGLKEGADPDSSVTDGSIHEAIKQAMDPVRFVLDRDPDFIVKPGHRTAEDAYHSSVTWISDLHPKRVKIRTYAEYLSNKFSYNVEDIIVDIENLDGKTLRSVKERGIWEKMTRAASLPISEKIITIERTVEDLRSLMKTEEVDILGHTWDAFLRLVNQTEKLPDVLHTGFPMLDEASDIECGSLTFWAGWPSNGKSSVLRYLIHQFMQTHPDLFTFYVCTDDDPRKAHIHMLSIMMKARKRELEASIKDGTFTQRPEISNRWDDIHETLRNRICIMGYSDCYSLAMIRKRIEQLRAVKKNVPFLVIVDAINDLTDLSTDKQREGIETVIRELKRMAVGYDAAISAVSHLTKQDGKEGARPRLKNLKGTSFLEFAAKTIFLIHMSMHYNKTTKLFWKDPMIPEPLPIVEINVAKDKDNPANVVIPFKFDPHTGHFYEPDQRTAAQYIKEIDAENAAMAKRGGGGGGSDDTDIF